MDSDNPIVHVALIRVVVPEQASPSAQLIQIVDLLGHEETVAITASPDECVRAVAEWLRRVLPPDARKP